MLANTLHVLQLVNLQLSRVLRVPQERFLSLLGAGPVPVPLSPTSAAWAVEWEARR